MLDFFDSVGSFFSSVLSFITDFFGTIGSVIGSAISGVVHGIGDIFGFLGHIVSDLVGGFMDMLKSLFIPSDDFFSKKFDGVNTNLQGHVDIETYKIIADKVSNVSSSRAGIPNITINWFGRNVTIVDFSFIQKYKNTINDWVRGFMLILLLFYNINNVYKLIRGGALADGSGSAGKGDDS